MEADKEVCFSDFFAGLSRKPCPPWGFLDLSMQNLHFLKGAWTILDPAFCGRWHICLSLEDAEEKPPLSAEATKADDQEAWFSDVSVHLSRNTCPACVCEHLTL